MSIAYKLAKKGSGYVRAILLFAAALAIGTLVDGPFLKHYFPYVSFLLLLVVTWFLYKKDGSSWDSIGLHLSTQNSLFVLLGLVIGSVAFLLANVARSFYTGETIEFSDVIDATAIVKAVYFILPTVAVEELLFRGYLFKKTMADSNIVVANMVFALLFTLIHLFDQTILQRPPLMVMPVMSIPVGHLLFATALLKSRTLYFPIGLHLGNNWASRHLISEQNDGQSILVVLDRVDFDTWPYFIGMLLIHNGIFLLVTLLIWKWKDWFRG